VTKVTQVFLILSKNQPIVSVVFLFKWEEIKENNFVSVKEMLLIIDKFAKPLIKYI
jgi:hypothetical protein